MDFVDHYAVLGVSPSASQDDLREAYRGAARRFHPDVNKSPGASVIFRDINTAYETLSDPQSRNQYDVLWQDRAVSRPSLQLNTLLSREQLSPLDEPQLLYLMLKIQPVLEMSLSTDAPLNISIVIDRSTSMKGSRLQYVKSAVHRLIDETGPQDIISVVTFSDRAEVLIPSQHPDDPRGLKSIVSTIRADGATAIYSGMQAGLAEIERRRHTRYVNHMVLITDGRTYGDEQECFLLAEEAHERGISISGMGIGDDWNDRFLDELASRTGGSSTYINTPQAVTRFLRERIRSLATTFAERTHLTIGPTPNAYLESLFRIAPDPMALEINKQPIPLGALDGNTGIKLMLQFQVETGQGLVDEFLVGRIDLQGDVLGSVHRGERIIKNVTVKVTDQVMETDPPAELLDALNRAALNKLQDRARAALDEGNLSEATRKLEYLATRLFESGAEELGQAALYEARRVAHTRQLTEEGSKMLNYGTRALIVSAQGEEND